MDVEPMTSEFDGDAIDIDPVSTADLGDLNLNILPVPQETPDFAPQPTYTEVPQPQYQPAFSSYHQPPTDRRMMKVYLALDDIIQTLMEDPDATDFLTPVNPTQFMKYPHVVQKPMDLSTARDRLAAGHYKNIAMFASDVRLIFENAFKYTDATSQIAHRASRMSEKFEQYLLEKLLTPFQIQVVPTVSVDDVNPAPIDGLLARPKKTIGTPMGDFRKIPRHILHGGRENHRILPLRNEEYNTNAYMSHMKLNPSKKTFYTQKFMPYGDANPLTRAPSDFNYFYQQYVEYWANQRKEEAEAGTAEDLSQVTDEKWQELQTITSPDKKGAAARNELDVPQPPATTIEAELDIPQPPATIEAELEPEGAT